MLIAIAYQDFKFRAIHFFLVLGLFICALFILWFYLNSFEEFLYTALFIGVVLFLLWIYIRIKYNHVEKSFVNSIGLGDILFFFAVAPLFSLKNYMLFFISGMVISLIFYILFKNKMKTLLIPLAGILSCYLFLLIIISFVFDLDLFYQPISIIAFGNEHY
ncbi:hypothetical protein LDL78_14525 [Aequorivita sp. F7]|nr:hypothetical protein LDL78_14525 [Aequorivita sp. F7]